MLFKTLLPFVVAALAVGAHPLTPEQMPPQVSLARVLLPLPQARLFTHLTLTPA
jgi:hypothetical protein